MTKRLNSIIIRPVSSALRLFGASVDEQTRLPVSSFPSGSQMAAWDVAGPPAPSRTAPNRPAAPPAPHPSNPHGAPKYRTLD
jgi:hypothetical protein